MPDDQEVDLSTLGEELANLTEPFQEPKNSVKSRSVTVAPSSPAVGDRYIVPTDATGGWAEFGNAIATWINGAWKFETPTEGVSVWVDDDNKQVTFDGAAWVQTSGAGAISTQANKGMPAVNTTGDNQLGCAVALQFTPAPGSHITVRVNGVTVSDLGNGTKDGVSGYFSGDGGITPKQWSDQNGPNPLAAGDAFYWNQNVAGYPLATTDVIDFDYLVAA